MKRLDQRPFGTVASQISAPEPVAQARKTGVWSVFKDDLPDEPELIATDIAHYGEVIAADVVLKCVRGLSAANDLFRI